MKIQIHKRKIYLEPKPEKDIPLGLEVIFEPSKYWRRKNKTLEPIMRIDIKKGQNEYELPRYFRSQRISTINYGGQ